LEERERSVRTPAVVLLLVAAFALGWLAGRGGGGAGSETAPVGRSEPAVAEAPPVHLEGRHEAPEGEAHSPTPATPSPEETVDGTAEDPGPPPSIEGGVAWLDVTVEAYPAWPVQRGYVYALPAGSKGVDEGAPSVAARGRGPVRLPLPAPGAWDVGFVCTAGWIPVERVEVADGAVVPVVLRASGCAPVTLRVHGTPPEGAQASVHMDYGGSPLCGYPGRGGQRYVECTLPLHEGTNETPPLPGRFPYRLLAGVAVPREAVMDAGVPPPPALVVERATVRAGETVDVEVRPQSRLLIRVATRQPIPERWTGPRGARRPGLRLRLEVEGAPPAFGYVTLNEQILAAEEPVVGLLAPSGRGRLTWSGGPMVKGGALEDVVLPAGRTVEREVVFDLITSFDPFANREPYSLPPPLRLVVDGLLAGDGPPALECALRGCEGEEEQEERCLSVSFGAPPFELPGEWRRVTWALAVQGTERASAPVRGPFPREVRLELEPAGLLLVAPEFLGSEALGALRVARADGAPLSRGRWEEGETEFQFGLEADVGPGTLLGPFPARKIRFHVWLGLVQLPDAEAVVEAGRVTPLVIRR